MSEFLNLTLSDRELHLLLSALEFLVELEKAEDTHWLAVEVYEELIDKIRKRTNYVNKNSK